jgi:hypothetical protein
MNEGVPISSEDLVALGRDERLRLDSREPPEELAGRGLSFRTVVSVYSVLDASSAPVDAVMIREAIVRDEEKAGDSTAIVAHLRGIARSGDWPRLLATWHGISAQRTGRHQLGPRFEVRHGAVELAGH